MVRPRLLFLALSVLFLVSCNTTANQPSAPPYELTKVDVFAAENLHGDQVTVFDVGLGAEAPEVLEKIGPPDRISSFDDDKIINYEYSERLGLEGTGLMLRFVNGKVDKILIKKPFNKYLHGETIIDHEKEDIYFRMLGKPEKQKVVPFFRVFCYTERGMEVTLETDVNGYAFTYPGAVLSCDNSKL